MRFIISDTEFFERGQYRFAYDTTYKTFSIVQQRVYVNGQGSWVNVKRAPDNFYVYFPGFSKKSRNSNTLPNWK